MARPNKIGLHYYNIDTDRYQDIRIKKLKHAFGTDGVSVYDYLLCEIYRVKGCFLEWDSSTAFDVAEYFGLKETLIGEIVNYCGVVGLFNKELLTGGRVLTSYSIQQRFKKICESCKRKDFIIPESIELSDESTYIIQEETPDNSGESTQSKVKKSKVKETKEEAIVQFPFESEKFKTHWGVWKDYKKKQHGFSYKSAITEQGGLKELCELSNGSEEEAIQIINQSINKGWKGLFELKLKVQNGTSKAGKQEQFAEYFKQKGRESGVSN